MLCIQRSWFIKEACKIWMQLYQPEIDFSAKEVMLATSGPFIMVTVTGNDCEDASVETSSPFV